VDAADGTGNTVYAGGVGGGLWKTTNFKSANPTWTVVNDFFANLVITCIKQNPTNNQEIFFGTGEGWGNIDAIQGAGIWRSGNGGTSWTQATRWTTAATCTTAPVIHADLHDIQYLSSTELIISTDGGIYYSTNGGTSFSSKNGGYNVTQYYGMALHPTTGSNTMLGVPRIMVHIYLARPE